MYSLQQSYLPLQDTTRQSQIDSIVLATIQKTVLYYLTKIRHVILKLNILLLHA